MLSGAGRLYGKHKLTMLGGAYQVGNVAGGGKDIFQVGVIEGQVGR